jgi:hypothetical protein
VRLIFPTIRQISIGASGNECEILVWNTNIDTREGRPIPLSQSGSGISQVLAMLYIILISEFPKTIIIDEQTTFLHAGALRKLIEVMRNPLVSHQYIFTTHSPEVISIADPDTLLICRWESGQTILERLDRTKLTDHRRAMQEVGVRYSDVLGADRIMWVEGATEEVCFPMIVRHFHSRALVGTAIIGLRNTGDLLAKRRSAKAVAEIYDKLSHGTNLFPITVAFSLDREGLSEADQTELSRRLGLLVKFLPRRSFENYLLHPGAIAAVLGACAAFENDPLTADVVERWVQARGGQRPYYSGHPFWNGNINSGSWLKEVDAPKLLADLFSDLSGASEYYRKLNHSVALTEWLLKNEPSYFIELRTFVFDILHVREDDLTEPPASDAEN